MTREKIAQVCKWEREGPGIWSCSLWPAVLQYPGKREDGKFLTQFSLYHSLAGCPGQVTQPLWISSHPLPLRSQIGLAENTPPPLRHPLPPTGLKIKHAQHMYSLGPFPELARASQGSLAGESSENRMSGLGKGVREHGTGQVIRLIWVVPGFTGRWRGWPYPG